jgi:excinuclease ABC subunit B
VVEQVIRPTGLLDPPITVKPARGQVPDLLHHIQARAAAGQRTLVTTLTKRLAEDLAAYIQQAGIKGAYLHSEIDTIERVQVLRELREGKYDCLVGINLLREGLDVPEVSLVAILDADKEGFLRSATSLIQTIGRCARHVDAEVFLYADRVTAAMQQAIDETSRRRAMQEAYNQEHGITPESIRKAIRKGLEDIVSSRKTTREAIKASEEAYDLTESVVDLERQMLEAAEALEFEKAAAIRDRIKKLKDSPTLFSAP